MENVNSEVNCPLCSIPLRESLLYEDDKIYLVSTKDQRGHKVRVMACIKRHCKTASVEEQTLMNTVLYDHMTRLMGDDDWFIVGSEHASVPEHAHIIACDFPLEGENDPLFAVTSKVHFPLREKRVLIGVPAKDEEKTVAGVIFEAQKYGSVVVVDDGSTDGTRQVVFDSNADIIMHEKNLGYGASIRDLCKFARSKGFDVLVTLDADGQHDVSEVPRFLKALHDADVVVGNRFMGKTDVPKVREFGVKTVSKLSGLGDSQCGFRAYNKRAIGVLADGLRDDGMGASIEGLKVAQSHGLKIIEVPCTVLYSETSHSQNSVSHGVDLLLAFFWWAVWKNPAKTLLPLGLGLTAGMVVSMVQLVNLYLLSHYIVSTWALLSVAFLLCAMLVFNALMIVLVFKNRKVMD